MARQHGGATVIDLANDIIIDDEFKERLRPLTDEERNGLMIEIERNGFLDPLRVWQHHNILLDGHNRYEIWRDAYNSDPDREPPVEELAFPDREAVLEWIDKNQRSRRNLTPNELAKMRGDEYRETKQESHRPKKVEVTSTLNGKTSESLAEKHGVSERQIRDDAKFAEAIETIEQNVGKAAADEIVKSDKPPVSRKQVQQIAQLPAEQQAAALEQAKQQPKTKKSAAKTTKPNPSEFNEDQEQFYLFDALRADLEKITTRLKKRWPESKQRIAQHWINQILKEYIHD